jgi:hypothetical protein
VFVYLGIQSKHEWFRLSQGCLLPRPASRQTPLATGPSPHPLLPLVPLGEWPNSRNSYTAHVSLGPFTSFQPMAWMNIVWFRKLGLPTFILAFIASICLFLKRPYTLSLTPKSFPHPLPSSLMTGSLQSYGSHDYDYDMPYIAGWPITTLRCIKPRQTRHGYF